MPDPLRSVLQGLPALAQAQAMLSPDPVYRALGDAFDAAFYAQQLALPVRRLSHRSWLRLLAHYVTDGWKQGHSPSHQFDAPRYLADNPDVAAAGMEPLRHYLVHGRAEERVARAIGGASPIAPGPALARLGLAQDDLQAVAPWFDEAYYQRAYPDLELAPGQALLHYLEHGWREGRDPSPDFSTDFYLSANPDVRASGLIPLLHFARSGHLEGRRHRFVGSWRARLLARTEPLDARARSWQRSPPDRLLGATELAALLTGHMKDHRDGDAVIALLQDRYQHHVGGIQACAQDEQRELNGAGHTYVAINPYQPLPYLDTGDPDAWLCDVSVDGQWLGTASGRDALEVLAHQLAGCGAHLVVHSLLGHNCVWIERLAQAVGSRQRVFWLHDHFSLCTGFNLLRNDVSGCGAPPPHSDSCRVCVHGVHRRAHLARLTALFSRLSFQVVAPSASALALWTGKSSLPRAGTQVLPHRTLHVLPPAPPRTPGSDPLRVAFVGQPAAHKGWFVFRDLVDSLHRDMGYAWYHLGATSDPHPAVTHVEVRHTPGRPDAMQDAIRTHAIDIALVLSHWPETFCLAAHEALAGGAFVVAFAHGGHVADVVRSTGAGWLAGDEQALLMAFRDGSLVRAVGRGAAPRPAYRLESSGISAAALALRTGTQAP